MTNKKIVVVGARGYVGKELLPLLETHPQLEVKAVGSRMLAGESVKKHIQKYERCNFHMISKVWAKLNPRKIRK